MSTQEIQQKVKYINNARGKHTDVIIPFSIFQELLELKMSMEIFKQTDVQKSIRRAHKNIVDDKIKSFQRADEAIHWLKK